MEQRFERYSGNANHIFRKAPGSLAYPKRGGYRVFKSAGTWGADGITLRIPVKQPHANAYIIGRRSLKDKKPKKGIVGSEAAKIPVGGSVPRVVGSDSTENPASFGYVADASGNYAPKSAIEFNSVNPNDFATSALNDNTAIKTRRLATAAYQEDMQRGRTDILSAANTDGPAVTRRNLPGSDPLPEQQPTPTPAEPAGPPQDGAPTSPPPPYNMEEILNDAISQNLPPDNAQAELNMLRYRGHAWVDGRWQPVSRQQVSTLTRRLEGQARPLFSQLTT